MQKHFVIIQNLINKVRFRAQIRQSQVLKSQRDACWAIVANGGYHGASSFHYVIKPIQVLLCSVFTSTNWSVIESILQRVLFLKIL